MNRPMPRSVRAGYPLERLSTVRTGGAAELFARAGSEEELAELLAFAAAAGKRVSVVGSGSNLLIADEGVPGLVVKLDREPRRDRGGGSPVAVRRRCAPAFRGGPRRARGTVAGSSSA